MRPAQSFGLLKEAAASWSADRAPRMGAAISYYSVFSLAPLLVIVIAVAGLVFGADQVQGAVSAQLADLMGEDAARAVDEMLKHARQPKTGGAATALSILVLLFGASTVLAELQGALDTIWRVPEEQKPASARKRNAIWLWIRTRLLTFGMVLAMAFLMLISLVFSTALATLGKWWGPMFGGWEALAHAFDLAFSFGVLTLAFAVIYKFMPSTHIPWRDVWIGAAVTSLLFSTGKWAIGLYLGKSDVASSFGLFGSLALLMIWIYYSAQIFLLGAEFTWVYANRFGSRRNAQRPAQRFAPQPAANADLVEHVARVNAAMSAPPAPGRRDSLLRRHAGKIGIGAACLAAALLGAVRYLRRRPSRP
jgi:membrane protein